MRPHRGLRGRREEGHRHHGAGGAQPHRQDGLLRQPLHREGTQDGTWSLLDYGSFVVHVFQPETREYYRLEALWNDAPVIDLAAEAGLTDIEYSDRIAKMLGKE